MTKTLDQILIDSSAVIDLSATRPDGDDLSVRSNYADQAVWDAAAVTKLPEFRREYVAAMSSGLTLPLPSNFKEIEEDPKAWDGTGWIDYEVISMADKYTKSPAERFCYVSGDPAEGFNLILNNPQVGLTLSVIYQKFPNGFTTLTDKCEISDPQYVVRKIESYVLFSRNDDRFQTAEQRSQISLSNIISRGVNSYKPFRTARTSTINPLG